LGPCILFLFISFFFLNSGYFVSLSSCLRVFFTMSTLLLGRILTHFAPPFFLLYNSPPPSIYIHNGILVAPPPRKAPLTPFIHSRVSFFFRNGMFVICVFDFDRTHRPFFFARVRRQSHGMAESRTPDAFCFLVSGGPFFLSVLFTWFVRLL